MQKLTEMCLFKTVW